MLLHDPEVKEKVSKEEKLAITEESSKEEVEGLRRHVEVYKMSLIATLAEEILSWIRSVSVLKKGECKSEHQIIRNMLNSIAN